MGKQNEITQQDGMFAVDLDTLKELNWKLEIMPIRRDKEIYYKIGAKVEGLLYPISAVTSPNSESLKEYLTRESNLGENKIMVLAKYWNRVGYFYTEKEHLTYETGRDYYGKSIILAHKPNFHFSLGRTPKDFDISSITNCTVGEALNRISLFKIECIKEKAYSNWLG